MTAAASIRRVAIFRPTATANIWHSLRRRERWPLVHGKLPRRFWLFDDVEAALRATLGK